jgi:hypothetical protein
MKVPFICVKYTKTQKNKPKKTNCSTRHNSLLYIRSVVESSAPYIRREDKPQQLFNYVSKSAKVENKDTVLKRVVLNQENHKACSIAT